MKSSFLITIKPLSDFSAAVIASGAESPMNYLAEIEENLKDHKVKGKVLFDLLLAHGSKSNRYFIGEFDGEHFSSPKFQNIDALYHEFSIISARILKDKSNDLDSSLLSRAMQFAVKKGIPL